MGIVSALGRANVGIADYEDFIQTDAAINPGNSGGALVNVKGELVGINTAIYSTSGGYQGIGFAIPSNMVKSVMDSLIKKGKVVRGWLGVSIQKITPELAKQFNLKDEVGALVGDVVENSPAEKAGLKRGDVIIEYDGKKIEEPYILRNMIANTSPGEEHQMKVLRENKTLTSEGDCRRIACRCTGGNHIRRLRKRAEGNYGPGHDPGDCAKAEDTGPDQRGNYQ